MLNRLFTNRCEADNRCKGFNMDYNRNECQAVTKNSENNLFNLRTSSGVSYFEAICLQGEANVCSKSHSNSVGNYSKLFERPVKSRNWSEIRVTWIESQINIQDESNKDLVLWKWVAAFFANLRDCTKSTRGKIHWMGFGQSDLQINLSKSS